MSEDQDCDNDWLKELRKEEAARRAKIVDAMPDEDEDGLRGG